MYIMVMSIIQSCRGSRLTEPSTAVDTAYAEPNKDPPRAEEGDDTVEEMVGRISLHVRTLDNLKGYIND